MAENKYFYQVGYSTQEDEKRLKLNEKWAGKSLENVKEGVARGLLNEDQYGAFSSEFWKDQAFILICLEAEHDMKSIFNHIRKFLWCDKEFTLNMMSERWFYPITSVEFQNQEFDYFDFLHESLKEDKDIIVALNKLQNLETL